MRKALRGRKWRAAGQSCRLKEGKREEREKNALSDDDADRAASRLERKDSTEAELAARVDRTGVELIRVDGVRNAAEGEGHVDRLRAGEGAARVNDVRYELDGSRREEGDDEDALVARLAVEVDCLRVGDLGVDRGDGSGGHTNERRSRVDNDLVLRDAEVGTANGDLVEGNLDAKEEQVSTHERARRRLHAFYGGEGRGGEKNAPTSSPPRRC